MTLRAGREICLLFPTDRTTAGLIQPFRGRVQRFITDLERWRGCWVEIAATRRPEQRAWLMRQSWDLSHGLVALADVPTRPDLDIAWSIAGAREMVAEYELVVRPVLTSRHIEGRAIDMRINGWKGTREELYTLGRSFGVHKLRSDPPHWSDDGH